MFGKKKQQTAVAPVSPAPVLPPPVHLVPLVIPLEDRATLEALANEFLSCVECDDGTYLLDDATAVYVCTRPVPAIEIEYPDRLVTLHMEVYRFTPEDLGETGGAE